jgi:hypothetical protein
VVPQPTLSKVLMGSVNIGLAEEIKALSEEKKNPD